MKLSIHSKRAATLAGTALATTLGAAHAAADSHGFVAQELDSGYLLAAKADTEGKCGEGKCGESKSDAEGKCGEGKCGGASSDAKDSAEGKCGEGKCGGASDATKTGTEGKCGEGKCGQPAESPVIRTTQSGRVYTAGSVSLTVKTT
jgi:uncharacterized low-complexity protein